MPERMLPCSQAFQIPNVIVQRITVFVMDDHPRRYRSVMALPYLLVQGPYTFFPYLLGRVKIAPCRKAGRERVTSETNAIENNDIFHGVNV